MKIKMQFREHCFLEIFWTVLFIPLKLIVPFLLQHWFSICSPLWDPKRSEQQCAIGTQCFVIGFYPKGKWVQEMADLRSIEYGTHEASNLPPLDSPVFAVCFLNTNDVTYIISYYLIDVKGILEDIFGNVALVWRNVNVKSGISFFAWCLLACAHIFTFKSVKMCAQAKKLSPDFTITFGVSSK